MIRTFFLAVAILSFAIASFGQTENWKRVGTFDGHPVELFDPGVSEDGFEPLGSARVCVILKASRQCYTPKNYEGSEFGREPSAKVVQLAPRMSAILFTADSGGVSGWMRKIQLLRIDESGGEQLDEISEEIDVSNQCQWQLWNEPTISKKKILVVADYVWGDGEAHYGAHRFKISTYVYGPKTEFVDFYYLRDEFMTSRKYDLEKTNVLREVRAEILARLHRQR